MEPSKTKVIKRRNLGVVCRKGIRRSSSLGSKSGSNSSKKNSFFDRTGLKQKNKVLAATLNQTRIQNATLCQKLNQMKGEIFDLKGENVELRREKQAISATARLTESDIQKKLEEIIGPIRTSLQQAYNHTLGLSENMTNSLTMLESLQNHSDRGQNRLSDELAASWFQKTPASSLKKTPQASVPPRVMGFEIHKPKISISRLDVSALNQARARPMPRPQQPAPDVEPAAPEAIPPEQDDNVDTTNEADMDEPPILIRTRRRQRPMRHPPNIAHLGPLNENVEEEEVEEEEVEQGETVLLFPRLVLERIRLTPTRSSSISSRRASAGEEVTDRTLSPTPRTSTASPQQEPDTPRSRESFGDFSRRMGGLDPMEGPSWLFSDNDVNNGPKHTKSRDEKRKENSLKARLSSASRKLSIEPENEEENRLEEELPLPLPSQPELRQDEPEVQPGTLAQSEPEVQRESEEPRRRGGSRAAAQAARSSLKEPTLGSKLRQGDPVSNSVYNDFVPNTKRKSDRKSSKGSSSKKKKSSDGK